MVAVPWGREGGPTGRVLPWLSKTLFPAVPRSMSGNIRTLECKERVCEECDRTEQQHGRFDAAPADQRRRSDRQWKRAERVPLERLEVG